MVKTSLSGPSNCNPMLRQTKLESTASRTDCIENARALSERILSVYFRRLARLDYSLIII